MMTLILDLDLDILKMYLCTKRRSFYIGHRLLKERPNRTDKHTDRRDRNNYASSAPGYAHVLTGSDNFNSRQDTIQFVWSVFILLSTFYCVLHIWLYTFLLYSVYDSIIIN